jgi:D123
MVEFLPMAFEIPTDEERRPFALQTMAQVGHLMMEHWPEALRKIAIPATIVSMSSEEAQILIDTWTASWDQDHEGEARGMQRLENLTGRIQDAINGYSGPCFVKLGGRSPKDGFETDEWMRPLPVATGEEAIKCLIASQERIYIDLQNGLLTGYNTTICIRPYIVMEPWNEFRALIENGRLVGLSQMFYDQHFPQAWAQAATSEAALRAFVNNDLIPAMACSTKTTRIVEDHIEVTNDGEPINTFVADIILLDGKPTLIEVNPFGLSDPCLFKYGDDMDGSFRLMPPSS